MTNNEDGFRKYVSEHKISTSIAGLIFITGIASVINYVSIEAQDDRQPVSPGSCESPFWTTRHAGDPQASNVSQFFGRTGIVLHVSTSPDVRGARVAFKAPGAEDWTEVSDMVPVVHGKKDVTLGIGKGAVEFGVTIVAAEGDAACEHAPDVTVEEQGAGVYQTEPGKNPFPINPDEFAANLGLHVPEF